MKKLLAFIIAITSLLSVCAFAAELKFTDVPQSEWYYNDVKNAVEMGLINGKNETTYAPDSNLTYAEAFKLAACMHQLATKGMVTLKNGDKFWYSTYVEYCINNGIYNMIEVELSDTELDYDANITRAGYMKLFSNALPEDMLPGINYIPYGAIPDVSLSANYADGVYKLYRAGIVQGSDAAHSCKPFDNIKRSEVAAILTRMMDKTKRVRFDMGTPAQVAPFVIEAQPEWKPEADGKSASASVKVSGGAAPYKYTWQAYDEIVFDISLMVTASPEVGDFISGYDTDTLTVAGEEFLELAIPVRCIIIDSMGNKLVSDTTKVGKEDTTEKPEEKPEDKGADYYLENKDESRGENPKSPIKVTVSGTEFKFKTGDRIGVKVDVTGGTEPYFTHRWYRYNESSQKWEFYDGGSITPTNEYDPTLYFYDSLIETPGETFKLKCVVKDSEGYTGESDIVTITTPDFVLEKGLDEYTDMCVGKEVKLSVKVKGGKEPYTYKWYFGTFVIPTKSYTASPCFGNTSEISFTMIDNNLPASDNVLTSFKCEITDADGNIISTSTGVNDITPKNMPLTIIKQPERLSTPKYGVDTLFNIEVYGGKQPYTYEWFYDSRYRNEVTAVSLGTLPQTVVRCNKSEVSIKLSAETSILDKEIYCVVTDAAGTTVKSEKIAVCPDFLIIALEQKTEDGVYVGTVKCGELVPGARIGFYGYFDGNEYVSGAVEKIEMFGKSLDKATAGDRVGIYLKNVTVYENQEELKDLIREREYKVRNFAFEVLPSVLGVTHMKNSYGTTPGEDVSLGVYINGGSGTYTLLEWFKEVDGEWISFDDTKRGAQTKNGFIMSCLYRGDEKPGSVKVKCVVTDSDGNKAESTVITVITSGIVFEEELPKQKNVEVGDKVSLSVKVKGGKEPYTYNWYIGGRRYDGAFERYDLKHDGTCTGYDTDTVTFTAISNYISTPLTIKQWIENSIYCEVTDATGAKIKTGTVLK